MVFVDEEPSGDIELMQSVAVGDEAALRTLIDRWKNPLINFFYRSLNSYEQAEDLTQVVFIRIYRAAPRYEPKALFSTYLFHIARRLLINEYHRRQAKPLFPVDPETLETQHASHSKQDQFEIEDAFQQSIATLPENQRTAILLLKQQQLSYQEIADVMNSSESAVKTWIFRARQQLRSTLKELL